MPRGFTEREKVQIRRDLLQKGKSIFEAHGLRKTNVEDLTQAVGISKGAFYRFFPSKEVLFFDILQDAEADVRTQLLQVINAPGAAGPARLHTMLHDVVTLWKANPLFRRVTKDEYEYLLRKLPPEVVAAHAQDDDAFAYEFVAQWSASGVPIAVPPPVVAGLIRSLFFLSLHEDDFTPGIYPHVLDVLIDGIVHHLVSSHHGGR